MKATVTKVAKQDFGFITWVLAYVTYFAVLASPLTCLICDFHGRRGQLQAARMEAAETPLASKELGALAPLTLAFLAQMVRAVPPHFSFGLE